MPVSPRASFLARTWSSRPTSSSLPRALDAVLKYVRESTRVLRSGRRSGGVPGVLGARLDSSGPGAPTIPIRTGSDPVVPLGSTTWSAAGALGGDTQLVEEHDDASPHLVADGSHRVDTLPGRVVELPVEVALAGVERARVAAAHGDDDVRGLHGFGREELGPFGSDVDALLEHGLTNRGVDGVGRRGASGPHLHAAPRQVGRVRRGHLGAPRIVDAHEEHGGT